MARFIGNYQVLRELGSGHFGSVYLAAGEPPGRGLSAGRKRLVAIKKLKKDKGSEAARLLQQEFALLDQVKHRSIVRVFEYLEDEQAVVMEAVPGISLRDVMNECQRSREQVFTEAAIEIACEAADALYQAYTSPGDNGEPLRLVHRDLKPGNIILTPTGEVKLVDFGLARVDNRDFKAEDPGKIRGTPIYLSPEQARGEGVDHRTDLFALGLVTYELLENEPAYVIPMDDPDPVGAIYDAIERADFGNRIDELERRLPNVGPVIMRCLQARARDRYQNGQEVLVDLKRQLYRDRGAYLSEFADFFYGSLYDFEAFPKLDEIELETPRARGGSGKRQRLSIEERLRRSMDRERSSTEEVSRPGRSRSTPSDERESASPPPMARRGGEKRKPKVVGARSADETGMLELIPMGAEGGEEEEPESATAFFAIPAPRKERAPAAPPPPTAPTAPASGPVSPSPVASGPVASGPVASGPVVGGGAIASGPVAGAPVQPPPSAAPQPGKRVQSNRVYALILAVLALVCTAIVVFLAVGRGTTEPEPEVIKKSEPQLRDEAVAEPEPEEDTGQVEEEKPQRRSRSTTRSTSSTSRSSSGGSSAAPAAPRTPKGQLKVTLVSGTAFAVLVSCPDGSGGTKPISTGGSATFTGVGSNCQLKFQGPVPAVGPTVSGGQTKKCTINGPVAQCS